MKPRAIFGAYYQVGDGFTSTLGLNNSTQFPLTVYPTLYSPSGVRMPMAAVTVEPNQPVHVDMAEWVASLGGEFRSGSLQLEYDSFLNALGAQVLVVDEKRSLMLDAPVHGRHEYRSTNLEGLWWAVDRRAEMKVVVANTTDAALTAFFRVSDRDGGELRLISIPLGPHHSRTINLQDILARERGAVGGVSIHHDGRPGDVIAEGFVTLGGRGFSTNIRFHDPGTFGGNALHGAGVYLPEEGDFRGYLLLRNLSSEPLTANPILRDGDQEIPLGQLAIGPGASQKVDVTDRTMGTDGAGTAIEVLHSGLPGSLIGHWISVDSGGSMVVETPLRNPGPALAGSGSNPFMLSDDFESVLFVKNTGSQPSSFVGVIYHGNEKYMIGAVEVGPGKSVAIDVRKLRDEQVPDAFGKLLPLDLESGQFQWLHRSGPKMIGRMRILSRGKGISTNMSCPWCPCNPISVELRLDPDNVSAQVGDFQQEILLERQLTCSNTIKEYPVAASWWESSNPFVASANGAGVVGCWSPGTATIEGWKWVVVQYPDGTPSECESGPCDFEPTCISDEYYDKGTAFYDVSAPPPPPPPPTVTTDDVVVIAWVDPSVVGLPGGANQQLIDELNSPVCPLLLADWAVGIPRLLSSNEDRAYANAFLVKFSGNEEPPLGNPGSVLASGDFRLYSRFQVRFSPSGSQITNPAVLQSNSTIGSTPDPCGLLPPISGEAHPANGAQGLTPSGTSIYRLTEGRLGSVGQSINLTINGRTTPFIWNVIRFNASGTLNISDRAIFPSYHVYRNGQLVGGFFQSAVSTFVALDGFYQRQPGEIQ